MSSEKEVNKSLNLVRTEVTIDFTSSMMSISTNIFIASIKNELRIHFLL